MNEPDTTQTTQTPANDLAEQKGIIKSKPFYVFLGLVLILLVIGFGVYVYYMASQPEEESAVPIKTTDQEITQDAQEEIVQEDFAAVDFQTLLKNECFLNNEIVMDSLPFTISETTLKKYNMPDHFAFCRFYETPPYTDTSTRTGGFINYGGGSSDTKKIPATYLKIGNEESRESPMMLESSFDRFYREEPLNDVVPTIIVQDYKVTIEVLEPGPFGISSLGVMLNVRGYKPMGDFLVVAESVGTLEANDDILDLIIKYKDERAQDYEPMEGFPEYIVNTQKQAFIDEFLKTYIISYPDTLEEITYLIDSVIDDLDAVVLK